MERVRNKLVLPALSNPTQAALNATYIYKLMKHKHTKVSLGDIDEMFNDSEFC